MTNLQYEIRVPQKIYRRATIHYWAWYDFLRNRRYLYSYLFLKQVRIPDSESSKTQFGLISDELQKQLIDILQSDDTKEDNKVFQQAR